MDLLYEFNYCLLFVLFYLNFFIIFGRILGLKIKHVKPGFFTAHKPGFTGLKTGGLPGFSGTLVPGLHSLTVNLKSGSMSLKLVPFESLGAVSYLPSIVTMAVSVAVCEIFSVKEWCDLENRVRFVQGHWNWHHLIARILVPICLP